MSNPLPPAKKLNKVSMAMRQILEARGIDLIEMQMQVYRKAMDAFDNERGNGDKSDAGPAYLNVCNTAIGTLAKYAFPTMSAIKLEDLNNNVNTKVIDAVQVRQTILADPFAKSAAQAATTVNAEHNGLPVLSVGKKDV